MALAVGGPVGVYSMLQVLHTEIYGALALVGRQSIDDVTPAVLATPSGCSLPVCSRCGPRARHRSARSAPPTVTVTPAISPATGRTAPCYSKKQAGFQTQDKTA
jgi:hypothetical protein